jgi:Protein of unknown function (DUF2934)
MKSATAATPSRQEPTQPKRAGEPQVDARPADKQPESAAQRATASLSPASVFEFKSIVVEDEQIRTRAYELYVQDGYRDGNELEHWLAAERELRGENE